ncbi:oxygen-independent coproporphyrinogen-3 oxidase [Peptoniphilus olsenii]|uniref:Oxygen-independent coproporphyrinogen-3 oxidase n=1 Tax=Peptoniphilus olsenii TaxID=411570 RepID=A0ABV2J9G3_9FIRM
MITVNAEKEFLRKSLFEFLRMKFPDYISNGILKLDVINDNLDNWYIFLKLDDNEFIDSFVYKNNRNIHFEIKRRIFDKFSTNCEFDKSYGILTGVRPSKLSAKIFSKNSLEKSIEFLDKEYRIPVRDSKFLYEIFINQHRCKDTFSKENYNIYVNIPFCPSRCSYCSFDTAIYNKQKATKYVNSLLDEISMYENNFSGVPHSIYIGGGTPSILEVSDLEKILKLLQNKFGIPKEFTVECGRIDTLSISLLEMLKSYSVNRISLNPQSFNEKVVNDLNRNSNIDIQKWFDIAKKIGFDIINMDLILGLPGEEIYSILESVKKAIEIAPDNITIHTLALKNGSKLYENGYINKYDYKNLLDKTKLMMKGSGYQPYYMYRQKKSVMNSENIGYSLPNKNSIYNIVMMDEVENILGFGAGASTKILDKNDKFLRNVNTKNLTEYINMRG